MTPSRVMGYLTVDGHEVTVECEQQSEKQLAIYLRDLYVAELKVGDDNKIRLARVGYVEDRYIATDRDEKIELL